MARSLRRHPTACPNLRRRPLKHPGGWQPHLSIQLRSKWLETRFLLNAAPPCVNGITLTRMINAPFQQVHVTFDQPIDSTQLSGQCLDLPMVWCHQHVLSPQTLRGSSLMGTTPLL